MTEYQDHLNSEAFGHTLPNPYEAKNEHLRQCFCTLDKIIAEDRKQRPEIYASWDASLMAEYELAGAGGIK